MTRWARIRWARTRWARTRWARIRWARTRLARTRWPTTECRIEDGDIGDTRSPWPGQKWTRCRTTRSRSTAVRRASILLRRKKGSTRRRSVLSLHASRRCGQRTLHFFSQSKKQAGLEWFDILEAEKAWLERRGTQPKRVRPVKTVV